ncbi:DNA-binding protein HU-beta [Fusobacterium gonidiaformans 3-1-5R]|uniref:DNA-binding protein HU-beta n=2 Tax=Fusobacterium TaxID=848 RepID=E5BF91_9FUSO|nr:MULTISPECIES: HU family DNA-binding protein [Fusobacterium]AVQ17010.1 HU family DNA-binding protein [Fusobacterium gonidiaformans ATCC 25563]EFS20772.1 DNA-binding protein HU-beta [Fusobacterium gonidiaformans 3-1-5R]EFS28858.1 hypothetical protein FGAG_01179 [Fusobacterium gonidiaformans ATCC 25563]KXA14366.1 putative DNA-binding protein HU [Fusobacterium equinum]
MNKKDFIALFAKNAELKTKTEAEKLVAAFLNTVEETLVAGDGVAFMGFGKFETLVREARTCVNPRTKEKMNVAAKKVVRFKAGKALAEKVNVVEKKAKKGSKKSK